MRPLLNATLLVGLPGFVLLDATWSGVAVAVGPMAGLFAIVGTLAAVGHHYRDDVIAGPSLKAVAFTLWVGAWAGMAASLSARFGGTSCDADLAGWDATLGFSEATLATLLGFLADYPLIAEGTGLLYVSETLACVTAPVALILLGDVRRAERYLTVVGLILPAASIASRWVPALGTFCHYKLDPELLARLPGSAGTYHLDTMAWIQSSEFRLDPTRLDGIVTFPSLHVALAAALAFAAWGLRPWPRALVVTYSAAVAFTAIPIGGHYFVDALGGLLLFGASFGVERAMAAT